MFVLYVDTFKARAMFAPRSRALKILYEASLKSEYCFSRHHSFTLRKSIIYFFKLSGHTSNEQCHQHLHISSLRGNLCVEMQLKIKLFGKFGL